MSPLSILLIVAAVVTVLGLLIAWPVYCVLRKRGDSDNEESVDIARPKAPVSNVSLQTSVESIEPSAEPNLALHPKTPNPRKPIPGSLSPIGLSPRKKSL
uniref:Uncharacterized protein n=1 Tax=Caenorhabditis japonica TaxID=281687 RepID=A0A8R1IAE8_CAEJA